MIIIVAAVLCVCLGLIIHSLCGIMTVTLEVNPYCPKNPKIWFLLLLLFSFELWIVMSKC